VVLQQRETALRLTRAIALVLAALVLATALAACAAAPPSETPGITGTITSVTRTDERVSILVEGGKQPEGAVSDKAQVGVPPEADVFDAQGRKTSSDVLRQGAEVRVWFTGPVAESYPVQGTARAVQVVR
jgi:beta-N-acetylhexosaminidase